MPAKPLIAIVEDDDSLRPALIGLVRSMGYDGEGFSSAEAFLESDPIGRTQCLILDVSMPGMTGPELQRELLRRGSQIPVIFITAHADDTVRPALLEQGAVECLFKPFSETALLEALQAALGTP